MVSVRSYVGGTSMATALDVFAKSIVAAGLMSADEVKSLFEAIPSSERPRDGDALAQLLIKQGKITEFQAQHLLAGKGAALVVGEYLLVDRIGAGGMGQVFKARHLRMQRTVALKMMSSQAMKDEASVKRFQREVRAAARLEHPSIVTAYDAGQAGKSHYLVMQFVDGGDLAQWVKAKGQLPIGQAAEFIAQAARGLAYAHAEGVVHRDIKPANLLVDKKGSVKILDMGLARIADGGGEDLTGTEQVMGTVDYMSPEQASGSKSADGRADIYSLGCTLWFLLTGKRLYEAETLIARLIKHRDEALPSLLQVRDDAPWSLEQTLHKMIAKKPEDRFQTMDDVVAALDALRDGGNASGMGSSVLPDAGLASFLSGIGSSVGGASKIGSGSSNVLRPGSSGVLRPGSSASIVPLAGEVRVEVLSDSKSGSRPEIRPPSSGIMAATSAVVPTEIETDPGVVQQSIQASQSGKASQSVKATVAAGPKSSISGSRTSTTAAPITAKKKKNNLPLVLGGAAGALAIVVGAVALMNRPSGEQAAVGPKTPVVPVVSPRPAPSPSTPFGMLAKPVDFAAERRAAEWVIGKGGMVAVAYGNNSPTEHKDRNSLPSSPWSIRRISLADRNNVGDGEIVLLMPLAELEQLNLNRAGVTNRCLPYVGRLTTLRSLELNNANCRDADLDYLVGMSNLAGLSLHGSSVSEDGLQKLKHLPLKRLEIGSIVVGNSLGSKLRAFPQLETLRLASVGLQDSGLAELAALKNLRVLSLNGLPITDAALRSIASWTGLRELTIEGGSVTPAGLKVLSALTELRRLEIKGLAQVQEEVKALQAILQQTEVFLNGTRVAPRHFPLPPETTTTVTPNTLTPAEQSAGWKLLFDGQSLAGWKKYRTSDPVDGWWVIDGQLRGDGGAPYLTTDAEYEHYELTLEFRLSFDGNSGVNYHVDEAVDMPSKSGPELELVNDGTAGILWSVPPPRSEVVLTPPEAWHGVRLTTAPGRSRHAILGPDGQTLWSHTYERESNGVRTSQAAKDGQLWLADRGKITLQARTGMIAFRNIKLRPLNADEATKAVEAK